MSVVERRHKAQLLPAALSDTVASADETLAATSTPHAHARSVKDSPSVTPVRSKSGDIFMTYIVMFHVMVSSHITMVCVRDASTVLLYLERKSVQERSELL